MATRRLSFMVLLYLSTIIQAAAQQEIKIGERIPDLAISGIINQPNNKMRLKDLYKDGLLIIDFWFTSCVPCIREMKFLDSLKEAQPKKFNVLMVSYEDSTQIQNFLGRKSNVDIKTSSLVLATKDTILRKLFPHRVMPHNIWIDKEGIVRAITGTEEVTTDNILGFGKTNLTTELKTKKDNFTFDPFGEFHDGDQLYSYRSIITPYIDSISGGIVLTAGNQQIGYRRFSAYNCPLWMIYWQAYSQFVGGARIQLIEGHTSDSLRIFSPYLWKPLYQYRKFKNIDQYKRDYTYNYSITLPKSVAARVMRDYIFNDLERQFNIKAKIEPRKTQCMVVTKVKGEALLRSHPDSTNLSIKKTSISSIRIRNARIKDVLDFIWRTYDHRQVDEPFVTAIRPGDDLTFDLDLDFSDEIDEKNPGMPSGIIYKRLEKYGFRFKKELRSYPNLILYDQL